MALEMRDMVKRDAVVRDMVVRDMKRRVLPSPQPSPKGRERNNIEAKFS